MDFCRTVVDFGSIGPVKHHADAKVTGLRPLGVAYAGIGILIALVTRNVQATNASFLIFFPLLFLTPNFVPFDRLTPVMAALARTRSAT